MSELRDAALAYAAQGWPVFPIKPRGKEPLTEHGFNDATAEQRQVWQWWTRWPKANIGIACGHGCDVLDVDGPQGRASLAVLLDEHDQDPAVLSGWAASSSGRPDGGEHYWFAAGGPPRWAGFRPGLDWLGLRGYVIAPPSVHPSGRVYRWYDGMAPTALPQAPAWLLAAATRPVPHRRMPRLPDPGTDGGRPGDAFNTRADWHELLSADGWQLIRRSDDVEWWRRPGKRLRSPSATVGHVRGEDGSPRLFVFSDHADGLQPYTSYSPFSYWAATRHGGDFEAAARDLAARGYGDQDTGRVLERAGGRIPFAASRRHRP